MSRLFGPHFPGDQEAKRLLKLFDLRICCASRHRAFGFEI